MNVDVLEFVKEEVIDEFDDYKIMKVTYRKFGEKQIDNSVKHGEK